MHQVEIWLRGQIDQRWSEWLEGLTVTHTQSGETVLTGSVADQAALFGLMSKLRDLGVPLSAVHSIEAASRACGNQLPNLSEDG